MYINFVLPDAIIGLTIIVRLVQEMNKIEAYTETQRDPKEHVESYKKRFLVS